MSKRTLSRDLYEQAQKVIPGGVNSPVRAFNGVSGTPVFFQKGLGAYVFDADGNRYIDYVGSWGPLILGHNDEDVIAAVKEAIDNGMTFGAPTELEVLMATKVTELMPSIEQVRMVSSGTEATMSAIRLARGYTQRDIIVKFEGCYHGHADSLLVKAGSGALTLGVPSSPGVPADISKYTITLPFNDIGAVEECFKEYGDKIACVIVEPVAGNMNCIPPVPGFLETLREQCTEFGSVLILDEVMTGFRVALGGAQAHYGITPDLTTLGKVIGGGMPVGAFGGRKEIMQHLAPTGPVYQAGTLSGNPVAMAAGLATLEKISAPGFHDELSAKTKRLVDGIADAARSQGIALATNQVGGMYGLFFTDDTHITSFSQSMACDIELFKRFFHGMLDRGIYLAPSAFEAGFMSAAHSDTDIEETINAAREVFEQL